MFGYSYCENKAFSEKSMVRTFSRRIYKLENVMWSSWKTCVFKSWLKNMKFSSGPHDLFMFFYILSLKALAMLFSYIFFSLYLKTNKNSSYFFYAWKWPNLIICIFRSHFASCNTSIPSTTIGEWGKHIVFTISCFFSGIFFMIPDFF